MDVHKVTPDLVGLLRFIPPWFEHEGRTRRRPHHLRHFKCSIRVADDWQLAMSVCGTRDGVNILKRAHKLSSYLSSKSIGFLLSFKTKKKHAKENKISK